MLSLRECHPHTDTHIHIPLILQLHWSVAILSSRLALSPMLSMVYIVCWYGNRRNQNYHDILKGMGALKQRKLNQFFLTNHFHHMFFFGDLNYRVDLGATEIVDFAKKEDHGSIFKEDQLRKQMEQKKIFVSFGKW